MTSCPICGSNLDPKGKPRSYDQLKRYFALMRAVFTHWPEGHERQFANAEELRKWVQMKAGYREVGAQIPLTGMNRERALLLVEAAIRGAGSHAFPVLHGDVLVVFRPKSIAFDKMTPAAFNALNDAVEATIRQETGLDPNEVLRQTQEAA